MKKFNKLMFLFLFIYLIGCSAEVNVTKGEINVKQGNTNIPNVSGYFNFGNIPLSSMQSITFTIENNGIANLHLTGSQKVEITGQNKSDFTALTNQTATTILQEESTTFSVLFYPDSLGVKNATVQILNDDSDENPYTFAIVGTCTQPAPEIHVKQGDTDILCTTGSFDFGTVIVNESSPTYTFTIENNGNEILNLTGIHDKITLNGTDKNMFQLAQDNVRSTIAGNNTTTFDVTFMPTTAGMKTAQISILNDDSDENPYTFTITGTGVVAPEINIKQGADDILSSTGKYSFADTIVNEPKEVTFTIENIGASTLHIDSVTIDGSDATMFSENTTLTNENTAPGNSTTFTITFTPTNTGLKTATVSIANNDDDENPYTFTIEGKGVVSEINVKQDSDNIPNSSGSYDFGGVIVNTSGPEIEFTIENLGDGVLELKGSPIVEITGTNASEFKTNLTSTLSTINPSAYTTFKIQCNPTSKGNKTATVSIVNNDDDENPYTFIIKAYGSIYTEGDVNGDGLADSVFGAYWNDSGGSKSGCAYIFFGKASWNPSYSASTADVKLVGGGSGDEFGYSVTLAGDVNKDGFEDVVISAYKDNDNGNDSGCVFIFFGRLNWSSTLDATDANVKLSGSNTMDYFGSGISEKGDVNNDGIDDVIVGANQDDDGGSSSGCAFIFYGKHKWKSSYNASEANVKLVGAEGNRLGTGVSIAGDVNKDGIDDIVVGAHGMDSVGGAYIFFGKQNLNSVINASSANVKISHSNPSEIFGEKIASSGDINDDGIDDIVIGVELHSMTSGSAGVVYIFWGTQNWSSTISAANADVVINGQNTGDSFGTSVSTSTDINKDGVNDLIVGALRDSNNVFYGGCAYVYFGKKTWNSSFTSTNSDIKFSGVIDSHFMGCSVLLAQDINSDGYCDIIIGAERDRDVGNDSGCAFIFFGKQNWNSSYDATNANVKIIGEAAYDYFGSSISPN